MTSFHDQWAQHDSITDPIEKLLHVYQSTPIRGHVEVDGVLTAGQVSSRLKNAIDAVVAESRVRVTVDDAADVVSTYESLLDESGPRADRVSVMRQALASVVSRKKQR